MIYFHPYTGMTKTIGVLSSKNNIFTSKLRHLLSKTYAITFPPARFSYLNLSPAPVHFPAQSGQGINLDNQSFPLETRICL